jgi:nucleotide-binding universal stress UspA family protein
VLNDVAADVIGTYRDALVKGIENQMQRLIPEDALDWCNVDIRVETGLPAKMIPKIVNSEAFDLLVMNIHGKTMLDRVLIGSTAERTLRAAAGICPVLLIPPSGAKKGKTRK